MEISAEKTGLMAGGATGIQREMEVGAEVGHCNKLQVRWGSCFG